MVVKCLLQEKDFLIPSEKSLLETNLFGYSSKGFSRILRSSLRLHGSYLGRDYKLVMQQLPIVLTQLISSGESVDRSGGGLLVAICRCFNVLGKLVSLLYISKIKFESGLYLCAVASTYDELRRSIMIHDACCKNTTLLHNIKSIK